MRIGQTVQHHDKTRAELVGIGTRMARVRLKDGTIKLWELRLTKGPSGRSTGGVNKKRKAKGMQAVQLTVSLSDAEIQSLERQVMARNAAYQGSWTWQDLATHWAELAVMERAKEK